MVKPIGGRGKKAPYQTKTIRIPVELEGQISQLIEQYRQQAITGDAPDSEYPLPLHEAVELAQKLLRAKKAKQDTVKKLVTGIYGVDEVIINL